MSSFTKILLVVLCISSVRGFAATHVVESTNPPANRPAEARPLAESTTPPPFNIECQITSRQGYSSEAAARENPNASSGHLTHTNLGITLESTVKRTIKMEDSNSKWLQQNAPSSVAYFGMPKPVIAIGSGLFIHIMLDTADVKSNPERQWKGWTNSKIYSEVFRRNSDRSVVVVTSPNYAQKNQYWAPGTELTADLLGTESRNALYNLPKDQEPTFENFIKGHVAPEGFLLSTHVKCTRAP